ncbi:hypothetical protein [Paenibacillus monticola]|uniref:hypothetical protein n=1 Tax=Paenibacillus monticola TaxID=2666075 RepID=UPI00189E3F31|nr:hypothetical protein [Paenibacillus monticola]
MKVIGLLKYGGPEVLETIEIKELHAGPGEVRIRVHAAGKRLSRRTRENRSLLTAV